MPALLWQDLVFDVNGSDAGPLIVLHATHHVDLIPITGVGISNHREVDGGGDASSVVNHLAHAQQPNIGATQQRRSGPEARHVRRVETRLLDKAGTECIGAAGSNEWRPLLARGIEELSQGCGPHRLLPQEV